MADSKDTPVAQLQPASPFFAGAPVQSNAVPAGVAETDPKDRLDETVEGGRYKVGDVWVDAEGRPLKSQKDK